MMSLSYLLEVQMYNTRFQKEVQSLKRLEAEVQSLKHDWLMVDEVCDLKEERIRTLTRLATNVVKHELEWDDNLAIAISNLKEYLDNQIVAKIRTDMSTEAKALISDESIVVRDKHKAFRKINNPNYKPNKNRRTQ